MTGFLITNRTELENKVNRDKQKSKDSKLKGDLYRFFPTYIIHTLISHMKMGSHFPPLESRMEILAC